jgi:hypothetical protein
MSAKNVKCPFCGAENLSIAVFCEVCGKKIAGLPLQQTAQPLYIPPPPPPLASSAASTKSGQSNRKRNIAIIAVAIVLIASLAVASVVAGPLINGPQPTPTPSPANTPRPTDIPTAQPTVKPTPTATATTQPQNNTITGINVHFVYNNTDPSYFGADNSFNFPNQPNGMLSLQPGQQFWYSLKLTAGSGAAPDSFVRVQADTSGFSVVSTTPPTPIAFSAGSSTSITITFSTPTTTFDGPVNIILTTGPA